MKLLYVTPNATDPLALYRGSGVLRRLRQHHNIEYVSPEQVSWAMIVSCDIVFMQRAFNAQHAEVVAMCKKYGVPVVVDFDDWLYDLMPDNPAYSLYLKCRDSLEAIRKGADRIIVSNNHMKRMYADLGSDSVVVPNAYDSELFTPADPTDRNKIVLWRGGSSHTQDLLSVRQGWAELIAKHRDWQFIFINCYPWWLGTTPDNVRFIEGMNAVDYMEALQRLAPAVMTHPLLDTDFNRCKSMCSWIEASHAGSAFVGPDFEEFERPGLERYTPESSESFYTTMDGLMSDPHRIVHNTKLGQAEILGALSLREVNKIRAEVFYTLK